MPAAIGTKNKMRTCVLRREKGSDRLPPSTLALGPRPHGPRHGTSLLGLGSRPTISKTLRLMQLKYLVSRNAVGLTNNQVTNETIK
jgi:hypothetical protein